MHQLINIVENAQHHPAVRRTQLHMFPRSTNDIVNNAVRAVSAGQTMWLHHVTCDSQSFHFSKKKFEGLKTVLHVGKHWLVVKGWYELIQADRSSSFDLISGKYWYFLKMKKYTTKTLNTSQFLYFDLNSEESCLRKTAILMALANQHIVNIEILNGLI